MLGSIITLSTASGKKIFLKLVLVTSFDLKKLIAHKELTVDRLILLPPSVKDSPKEN